MSPDCGSERVKNIFKHLLFIYSWCQLKLEVRDQSLFRGGGGLVQIGRGSMIFMQGKRGPHNLSMHIRELYHTKGERVSKNNVLHKGEGQENLKMTSLHLHQHSPPLNNNLYLIIIIMFNFGVIVANEMKAMCTLELKTTYQCISLLFFSLVFSSISGTQNNSVMGHLKLIVSFWLQWYFCIGYKNFQ